MLLIKSVEAIDIKSLQNRLLKVCYVPATSAGLPRVSFFFSFLFLLLQPLTVLMKQTRHAVHAVKQLKAEIRGFVESQFFSNFSALWFFLELNFN